VKLQADLPRLRGDRFKILQVLLNLLSNAIKFTPPGGAILVRSHLTENGDFVIAVEDTGIGIAAKDIKTVLEPFGQVGNAYTRSSDGTGLGLTIVKSIVEKHGSSLHLESDFGTGTHVSVHFPTGRVVRL
jgi:signal transduction histidine kinase